MRQDSLVTPSSFQVFTAGDRELSSGSDSAVWACVTGKIDLDPDLDLRSDHYALTGPIRPCVLTRFDIVDGTTALILKVRHDMLPQHSQEHLSLK